ncbi:hypothetical protein niasHS_016420 [Heterodera schachtii]|uniref:C2H2-type domain-containing protein n=1 Tax=Heterodera schachtii TaxID=97005 RepID=A0ABD2HMZ2_HETSC
MASTIRQNRRKQDISALFAESEFPPSHTKRQRTVPSPAAAAEFGAGVCAGPNDNDLEDDELRFRGFSYTCATGRAGDAKSFLDTFACQRCPDIFNSRIGLTNHSKLHGAQLPLGCDFCDFSCTNTKTLRQHRRAHGYLPRPRRSSAQKSVEKKKQKPYVEPIYAGEEKIIIFCPNKAADDGEKGTAENAIGDDAEENADEQQFDDPPMLARATLNRAGLEEEDEEETAEEASVSHLPTTSFSSATTSTTTMAQRHTRKKAANPTKANAHNKEGTGVGTSAAGRRRQKGVGGPIRCSKCPFTSPSRVRLQSHMDGHYRSSGFLCSVCGYKHESVGWLHLHCTLHLRKEGIQFQWPPAYVKEAEEETEEGEEEEKEHNVQKSDRR